MPSTLKAPAFKKGDKAKRTCNRDCTRIKKCKSYYRTDKAKTRVEIDRMNPLVHGCYDVVDEDGISSTCPRNHLEKIEESAPYWGPSQEKPMHPMEKAVEAVSEAKKCDPVAAGARDFGYGPACSFVTCHAMRNENHSSSCPKTGPFNPEAIL